MSSLLNLEVLRKTSTEGSLSESEFIYASIKNIVPKFINEAEEAWPTVDDREWTLRHQQVRNFLASFSNDLELGFKIMEELKMELKPRGTEIIDIAYFTTEENISRRYQKLIRRVAKPLEDENVFLTTFHLRLCLKGYEARFKAYAQVYIRARKNIVPN
jgi:hypothetical protein